MTVAPLFTMLTEKKICVVSVVKINKIGLPKLVFSKFGGPKTSTGPKVMCVVGIN
jgi:hypothetical protein